MYPGAILAEEHETTKNEATMYINNFLFISNLVNHSNHLTKMVWSFLL